VSEQHAYSRKGKKLDKSRGDNQTSKKDIGGKLIFGRVKLGAKDEKGRPTDQGSSKYPKKVVTLKEQRRISRIGTGSPCYLQLEGTGLKKKNSWEP